MIEPLMATMLGVRDDRRARRAGAAAARADGRASTSRSTRSRVDGECSTNDCVFALANGASGVTIGDDDFRLLVEALRAVCEPLAIGIVRGGEGATKLITVQVTGAPTAAGREARGARDRQLAAGEDGGARRRSELGPAGRGRRTRRRRRSSSSARECGSARRAVRDGGPYDERAPQAADYLQRQGRSTLDGRPRHGRTRRARGCGRATFSAEYVKINAEYRT